MKSGVVKTLKIYVTVDGDRPFVNWLEDLKDKEARAKIKVRLDRLAQGNPGDYKCIGEELYELRLTYGPGYRIYFGQVDDTLVLLLIGGTKPSQKKDISLAQNFWSDYKQREGLNESEQ